MLSFGDIATDSSVQTQTFIDVLPNNGFNHNRKQPLLFSISGGGGQLLDFKKSRLYVKCHIEQANGNKLPQIPTDLVNVPEECRVGPVNLLLHAMWKRIEVYFNNELVSSVGQDYPYKSIIDTLLNYGSEAKKTQLQAQLFFKDDYYAADYYNPIEGQNNGLKARQKYSDQSRVFDMEGALNVDIFQHSDLLLLNGVDVHIKMWPSDEAFNLLSPADDADYRLVIDEALFRACKVTLDPSTFLEYEKQLTRNTAKYPYMRSEILTHVIEKGVRSISLDNLFRNRVPAKLCIGFVSTQAYNGAYTTCPFNFHHFNLNYLSVHVNGISITGSPYEPNFSESQYIREYLSTLAASDKLGYDTGNYLSRNDFGHGYALYVVDIDREGHSYLKSSTGNVKLEVRFDKPINTGVTLIAYALFPSCIEIDQARNVILPA